MSNPLAHPLDRPIWSILTGRQAPLAIVRGGARRIDPAFGIFAAVEDASPANLSALGELVRAHGDAALVEPQQPPPIPGVAVKSVATCWQMVADTVTPGPEPTFVIEDLTDADAPEMLALATLTRPGPFVSRTHELGQFIGIWESGRLIAMAGERMKPDGFTEVSGVCTHPDHRARGYAAALMRVVAGRIRERGDTPFLHAYADNRGAIGLYETLGFRFRRELTMTNLTAEG